MEERPKHFLYSAALFVTAEPYIIYTVLGSCIAVCVWDPVKKYGGMNHFMLPYWNGSGLASPKYGNIAIPKLIEKMVNLGSNKSNLQAKVFGGGEVIETAQNLFNIGSRNTEVAFQLLKDQNIPIISSSVGGKYGRKILFDSETGQIKQKYIPKSNSNKL